MHTHVTEETVAGTATGETWTGPGPHGPGCLPAGGLPLPQAAGMHLFTCKAVMSAAAGHRTPLLYAHLPLE